MADALVILHRLPVAPGQRLNEWSAAYAASEQEAWDHAVQRARLGFEVIVARVVHESTPDGDRPQFGVGA